MTKNHIMKRKVIKQGNDTLTITLPREWTKSYGIKAGDEIHLERRGNTLILSTDKLFSFGRKSRDISNLKSVLPLVLLHLYRKGYDEVELRFEKPETSIVIDNIIRSAKKYEIAYILFSFLINFNFYKAYNEL